jgi:hypothetical protein
MKQQRKWKNGGTKNIWTCCGIVKNSIIILTFTHNVNKYIDSNSTMFILTGENGLNYKRTTKKMEERRRKGKLDMLQRCQKFAGKVNSQCV